MSEGQQNQGFSCVLVTHGLAFKLWLVVRADSTAHRSLLALDRRSASLPERDVEPHVEAAPIFEPPAFPGED
jgi:hypothetical protein